MSCRYQHHPHEKNTVERPHNPNAPQAITVAAQMEFQNAMDRQRALTHAAALANEVGHLRNENVQLKQALGHSLFMRPVALLNFDGSHISGNRAATAVASAAALAAVPVAASGAFVMGQPSHHHQVHSHVITKQQRKRKARAQRNLVNRVARKVKEDLAEQMEQRDAMQREQQLKAEIQYHRDGHHSSNPFRRDGDDERVVDDAAQSAASGAAPPPTRKGSKRNRAPHDVDLFVTSSRTEISSSTVSIGRK